MATIAVTVPDGLVATLAGAADELLAGRKVDTKGMGVSERVGRYVAEVLKDVVVQRSGAVAEAIARSNIEAARAQATADAEAIG